jgi:hypothetical protein
MKISATAPQSVHIVCSAGRLAAAQSAQGSVRNALPKDEQDRVGTGQSPPDALRLVERFERHDTRKHGSWLNMAECELSVLLRQCLDRRIANKQVLIEELAA